MAHKCTQCGREFQDGSNGILKGCPSCGGKKFLFIRPEDMHKDVLEEKSIKQIAEETKEQFLVIKEENEKQRPGTVGTSDNSGTGSTSDTASTDSTPGTPGTASTPGTSNIPSAPNPPKNVEMYERIESITVINPGSYELNLEKLAESDELVIRMGNEDRYMVDIHSMGKNSRYKPKPKPKPKKKR